jgi:hypothetical protein
MCFVSTVLRGATEVVLAEIEAQRQVRHVAALAADRCKDALTDAEANTVAAALSAAHRTIVAGGFNAEVLGEHAAVQRCRLRRRLCFVLRAVYISFGVHTTFLQQHMPHKRNRMMAGILAKKIHAS